VRSFFADDLPVETIDAMIAAVENAQSPMSMVQVRPLGGAFGRVAPGETAFAHRERSVMVAVLGLWLDETDDPDVHRSWTVDTFDTLRPIAAGVYSNFLADEGEARVHDAYPDATYARLAEVKRQYDPENVFRFNQNIRPAN
jgi:FAD/FMN-containing dehydrogenase